MDDKSLDSTAVAETDERLPFEQDWGERLRAAQPGSNHLTGSQIAEMAFDPQPMFRYPEEMSHIARCLACRQQYKEMRALAKTAASLETVEVTPAITVAALPVAEEAGPVPVPAKPEASVTTENKAVAALAAAPAMLKEPKSTFLEKLRALFWTPSFPVGVAVAAGAWLLFVRPTANPGPIPTPDGTQIATLKSEIAKKEQEITRLMEQNRKLEEGQAVLTAQIKEMKGRLQRKAFVPDLAPPTPAPQLQERQPYLVERSPRPTPGPSPGQNNSPQHLAGMNPMDLQTARVGFAALLLPVQALRFTPDTTRGSSQTTAPGEKTPVLQPLTGYGTVVLETQPLLSWQPVEKAARYELTIVDAAGETSPIIYDAKKNTQFRPETSFIPGMDYQWQVKALDAQDKLLASTEKLTLRVMTEEKATAVRKAADASRKARLAMAKTYAEAGLLDDAERTLTQLLDDLRTKPETDPVSAVRKAAESLRQKIVAERPWKEKTP